MSLPQKCLILDADEHWRELFEELLTSQGIPEVFSAAPDSNGLQTLTSITPNLLILDIPEDNSEHWISQIPAISKLGIKVIAISCAAKKTIVLQSIQNGAIHFIIKGKDLELVEISLESCLKRTQFPARPNSAFKPKQFDSF